MDIMTITNSDNFIWNGKETKYYDVEYRGKHYRKYTNYWAVLYPDGTTSFLMATTFQAHLDKVWDKLYGGKFLNIKIQTIVDIETESNPFNNGDKVMTPDGIGDVHGVDYHNGTIKVAVKGHGHKNYKPNLVEALS